MYDLDKIFTDIDDFCNLFLPQWKKHLIESKQKQRFKSSKLCISEVMTILIMFHSSRYRDFKSFYLLHVLSHLKSEFPNLVSYTRMLALLQSALIPLCAYLTHKKAKPTGIAFIDSSKLQVCHNIRIPRNKVFNNIASRGKTSTGWFYGFKLHLLINDEGGILSVKITKANINDRVPVIDMCADIFGSVYADKGYLSKELTEKLNKQGINFVTNQRKNMKAKAMKLWDRLMLRKRFIIETVFDQLKNISQIEHSRHRSPVSFLVNLISGLIAYTLQPKKPRINITRLERNYLMQI